MGTRWADHRPLMPQDRRSLDDPVPASRLRPLPATLTMSKRRSQKYRKPITASRFTSRRSIRSSRRRVSRARRSYSTLDTFLFQRFLFGMAPSFAAVECSPQPRFSYRTDAPVACEVDHISVKFYRTRFIILGGTREACHTRHRCGPRPFATSQWLARPPLDLRADTSASSAQFNPVSTRPHSAVPAAPTVPRDLAETSGLY